MDFELSEDQGTLISGLDMIFGRYRDLPANTDPAHHHYSAPLAQDLAEAGFFEVANQPGFGQLDAALMVEAAAKLPFCVEVGASALVAPMLAEPLPSNPVALCLGLDFKPVRFLNVVKTAFVLLDDDVLSVDVTRHETETLKSTLAYPFGRWTKLPDGKRLGAAAAPVMRRWWKISVAIEAAGLLESALDQTVSYVKDRRQFGQPLGAFQAIQHRLARCVQFVTGARWLALRAAATGTDADTALACLYMQDIMRDVINDLHQFTGAMGLTLEYPLHLWTYRLKALQGELGSLATQTGDATRDIWAD